MMRRTLMCLAVSLGLAASAHAQSVEDDADHGGDDAPYAEMSPAWQAVFELAEPSMTGFQLSHLTWVAFHTAASKLCDGLVLDRGKMALDLELFEHALTAEMTDEEIALHHNNVMIYVGMATGVALAENAADPTELCAEAQAIAADQEVAHLFDTGEDPAPE